MSLGCATCLLTYDAQVWSSETMVNGEGEGQAGSCRGTGSGEGRTQEAWTEGPKKLGD